MTTDYARTVTAEDSVIAQGAVVALANRAINQRAAAELGYRRQTVSR